MKTQLQMGGFQAGIDLVGCHQPTETTAACCEEFKINRVSGHGSFTSCGQFNLGIIPVGQCESEVFGESREHLSCSRGNKGFPF